MSERGILIAGIGNIFLGDDAFGVEVVRLLARRLCGDDIRLEDFGIRSFDLMLALEQCDAAILVDAVGRAGPAGTLLLIDLAGAVRQRMPLPVEPHALDATSLVHGLDFTTGRCKRAALVACDCGPEPCCDPLGMSEAVMAAVEPAAAMVERVLAEIRAGTTPAGAPAGTVHLL